MLPQDCSDKKKKKKRTGQIYVINCYDCAY